jgi:hypothetical protein
MKKSWRTTLAGLVGIAGAIATIVWPEYAAKIGAISTAIVGSGLLAARDNKVSSEDAGAK